MKRDLRESADMDLLMKKFYGGATSDQRPYLYRVFFSEQPPTKTRAGIPCRSTADHTAIGLRLSSIRLR